MSVRKHITIYDIAREAQVSPATVSRILNGSSTVREEKRERVRQLIDKYNFHPNAMARALSDAQTRVIGMMVADVGNPYYNSLLTACVNAAYQRGYATMMFNTLSRAELEDAAMARLREQRADAMIIIGGRIDLEKPDPAFERQLDAALETMPIVSASRSPRQNIYGVAVDHPGSVDVAMDYLLGLGHTEIGFVYTGAQFYGTQEKLARFRQRMAQAGLPVREEWLIPVRGYDSESGREGIERLMQLEDRPQALLALNDVIAVGMLQGLLSHGVQVPQQISLIGFDDTFITNVMTPQLTAVGYNYDEYAAMLMDAAVAAIEGRESERDRLVAPRLFEKQSCDRPHSKA